MFSHLKNVTLGSVCKRHHDHGGGSYRHKNGTCVSCEREKLSKWHASPAGREMHKRSKAKHKDKLIAEAKVYRVENRDKLVAYNKKYRASNNEWYRSYYRVYNTARKASVLRATPAWADQEKIGEIYKEAVTLGAAFHVDHTVPLKSKQVCGLHVEYNLRIMPGRENLSKGNRHWPNMP